MITARLAAIGEQPARLLTRCECGRTAQFDPGAVVAYECPCGREHRLRPPLALPPVDRPEVLRLLGWRDPPFSHLNDLDLCLSDAGVAVLHALPESELRRLARWWARVKRKYR